MNKLIITGGWDGIVRVHNIDTHSLIQSLQFDHFSIWIYSKYSVLKGDDNSLYIGGSWGKLNVLKITDNQQ